MASTSTVPAPAANATPDMPPLKAWQRISCKIGIYLAVVFLCVGIGGILVVTGVIQLYHRTALVLLYTCNRAQGLYVVK